MAVSKRVHALLETLFKDVEKSPVAFRPARIVYRYLRDNLQLKGIPLSVVLDHERRYVRENQVNKAVPTRRFKRLKYVAYGGLDDIWQLDLVDFKRGNYSFILTKIDVFSRRADAELLANKRGPTVVKAFDAICRRNQGQRPRRVQTDEGKEFFNAHFKKYCEQHRIHLYKVNSEVKAALVERLNGTLQTIYQRYRSARPHIPARELLRLTLRNYNAAPHSSLHGLAPGDVDEEVGAKLLRYERYKRRERARASLKRVKPFRYKEGDAVRVLAEKKAFSKAHRGTYTEEVFKITRRFRRASQRGVNLYRVKDLTGEEISGIFYEGELQKVIPSGVPKVKKVWRRDKKNKRKLVEFLDYPVKHRAWINE